MRPRSIILFGRLYLAAILLTVIGMLWLWPDLQALADRTGNTAARPAMQGALAVGVLIPLLIWWLVAWRRSPIGKWLCVTLFATGLVATLWGFGQSGLRFDPSSLLSYAAMVLRLGAVVALFQQDARAWFGEKTA